MISDSCQVFLVEVGTGHPCWAPCEFLTHSVHAQIKWWLSHFAEFGEVCQAAIEQAQVVCSFPSALAGNALPIDPNSPWDSLDGPGGVSLLLPILLRPVTLWVTDGNFQSVPYTHPC